MGGGPREPVKSDEDAGAPPCWVQVLPFLLGALTAALATAALAGWALDMPRLRTLAGPAYPVMVPATGIVLLLQALAVICLAQAQRTGRWALARLGGGLALATLCVALVVLAEYAAEFDAVDTLLFRERVLRVPGALHPGRMSPQTAAAMILLALALASSSRRADRSRRLAQPLSAGAIVLALLGLTGHLYGVTRFLGVTGLIGMAVPTALGLLCVGLAGILLTPERGAMALLLRPTGGGVLLRRLLFASVLVPLGLAVLIRLGERAGLFDLAFSVALFVLLTIVLFAALVLSTAGAVLRVERERVEHASAELARARVTAERDRAEALAEALRQSHERRELLLSLQAELVGLTSPEAVARTAVRRLGERLHVTGASLALVDEPANEITIQPRFFYGIRPGDTGRFPLSVWGGALEDARAGRTVVIHDTATDPRTSADQERYHARFGVAAAVMAPLFRGGEWVAFVAVHSDTPRQWTEDDTRLVRDVADFTWSLFETARLLELLRATVRARDDFLSIASHELRTPLTPLTLRLQALERLTEKQPDSPYVRAVRSYLEAGGRQVSRLAALVNELLDVSRIQQGKLQIQREDVDLVEVVREVVERLQPEAARAGCAVAVHAPPSVVGSWDQLRLEQVVDNLLSNALKYGPGKPVEIRVGTQDGVATLTVQDEGLGIPIEAQERIFRRFERAVSERNYGGLGLGLYIVRSIVEALGGEVSVRSAPGEGASFMVTLPLRPE